MRNVIQTAAIMAGLVLLVVIPAIISAIVDATPDWLITGASIVALLAMPIGLYKLAMAILRGATNHGQR